MCAATTPTESSDSDSGSEYESWEEFLKSAPDLPFEELRRRYLSEEQLKRSKDMADSMRSDPPIPNPNIDPRVHRGHRKVVISPVPGPGDDSPLCLIVDIEAPADRSLHCQPLLAIGWQVRSADYAEIYESDRVVLLPDPKLDAPRPGSPLSKRLGYPWLFDEGCWSNFWVNHTWVLSTLLEEAVEPQQAMARYIDVFRRWKNINCIVTDNPGYDLVRISLALLRYTGCEYEARYNPITGRYMGMHDPNRYCRMFLECNLLPRDTYFVDASKVTHLPDDDAHDIGEACRLIELSKRVHLRQEAKKRSRK